MEKATAKRPRRKVTYEEIATERVNGLTYEQIAKKFEVSVDTLERRIKEHKRKMAKGRPVRIEVNTQPADSSLKSDTVKKKYWYNKDTDTYITIIPGVTEP